jgi:hypothetical protein
MSTPAALRSTIARSIARTNYLRGSGPGVAHREWFHFWISAPNLELLINYSVAAGPRAKGRAARVVVIVREAGVWEGDVDEVSEEGVELQGGRVFAQMAENVLTFEGDVFVVRGRLRRRAVAFDIKIAPTCFPSAAYGTRLADGRPSINWLVVPRLQADGVVDVRGQRHVLRAAPTYHDHNWGGFSYRDVAWQWGHASGGAGPDALSVVFARLMNRAQTEVYVQALLLWRGPHQLRVFRDAELRVSAQGVCSARPFTVPRPAALLLPDRCPHVPAQLDLAGDGNGDHVSVTFEPNSIARIAVPNDYDFGTTVIHETVGSLQLEASIAGRPAQLSSSAVFEFLGGNS